LKKLPAEIPTVMKNLILLKLLLVISLTTFGWGQTGHRVTGKIADRYLNKKARAAIARILNGQSLAMASTWMDEIRSDSTFDYTADWHWVTIQDSESYDKSNKNPNGDVVATLERLINELKSGKLTAQQEAQALKFLIHLVGDIHQPLHVGGGSDRGGNDVKVSWFRTDSNLHRVWDSDMIDDTKLSYTELAESLEIPADATVKSWQGASVRDWTNESMSYRKQVYDIGNGKLGYQYSYKNFHIVRLRLLQAGVRLGGILNEIYGG
jgi:hypothetical protein